MLAELRTFGGFHIRRSGKYCPNELGPLCRRLLVFLIVNNGVPQRREKLVDLFYDSRDQKNALNALSSNISRLRAWLRQQQSRSSDKSLQLIANKNEILAEVQELSFLDSYRFEQGILQFDQSEGEGDLLMLEKALAEYRGPFMDGDDDQWILYERERFHCLFVRGQTEMMNALARAEHFEEALDCGRRILGVDPLREYVNRQVMLLFAANGQRADALRQFRRCRKILRDECDIEPMAETAELAERLQHCSDLDIRALLDAQLVL